MTEEQEEEFRNAIAERLELIAKVKQLTQRIEAMEQEANAKDSELLQLRSRLGELDAQLEDTEELKASYEDQIRELQDQLMEYQQNESRLYERPREDEGWKVQCHELEQELAASQEVGRQTFRLLWYRGQCVILTWQFFSYWNRSCYRLDRK
jgi:chromosome segregation ATPase